MVLGVFIGEGIWISEFLSFFERETKQNLLRIQDGRILGRVSFGSVDRSESMLYRVLNSVLQSFNSSICSQRPFEHGVK